MEIKRILIQEVSLVVSLFDQYRVFYKQTSNPELANTFLSERLASNESVIFAALDSTSGEIIPAGFTQLYPTYSSARATKNWILNDLFVHFPYRKKGIGKMLIETAMAFAKRNGSTYVQLETAIDNFTAQQLYEFIGFVKQPPDDLFYTYRIGV